MFWAVDGKTIICSTRRRDEDVNVAFLFSSGQTGFLHPGAQLSVSKVQIVDCAFALAFGQSQHTACLTDWQWQENNTFQTLIDR